MTTEPKGKKIDFWFHPLDPENSLHIIEKEDKATGVKRRYLKGITSGMKADGHGERMTNECIQKMQQQAKSGEILLYEGQHGVNGVDDLGRLVDSEITPTGDWITTYRLYDSMDGFEKGSVTLEKAEKLWRQVNGIDPYQKPSPRGFSIEGYIPDGGIMEMDDDGTRTKISDVELDGVVVVKRPAYKTSVVTAICKALDMLSPQARIHVSENIRGKFINMIADEETKQSYYNKRYKLDDALNETIEEIMQRGGQVKERLNLLMQEYSVMLIELLVEHQGVFRRPPDEPDVPEEDSYDLAKTERVRLFKNIQDQLTAFVDVVNTRKAKKAATKSKGANNGNSKRIKRRGKTYPRKHS